MKLGIILVCAVGTPFAALAGSLPFVTIHPTNQIVVPANNATLEIASTNATSYQWRFNGADVPWETNATLIITNAQTTNTGYYVVIAKNEMGWTPSQLAYLAVIDVGGTVPFSNLGNSMAQACYQMTPCRGDSAPITNATAQLMAGPQLDLMLPVGSPVTVSNGYFNAADRVVPNATPAQTIYYRVDITYTNYSCVYTQPSTTLKLVAGGDGYPAPSADALRFPTYIEWPLPAIWPFDCNGGGWAFTNRTLIPSESGRSAACPDGVYVHASVQWRKDGTPINGATNGSLIITNFQTADVGVYDVQAFAEGGAAISWKMYFSIQTSNGPGVFRIPRLLGSDFICDLEGVASRSYGIQWSSNLSTWSNLLTLTNTTGVASFTNSTGASAGRFYRAVLLP